MSFYRFALNYFYVVRPKGGSCASRTSSTRGGKAAGIKRQFKSILFVNYCQFFPFCGLEECAMHIDNPQMRGCSFAALLGIAEGTTDCGGLGKYAEGTTIHGRLGKYAEGRTDHGILGEVTPRAQQTAGVNYPSWITRITFGVMDIERRAIPYLSYAYPIVRFQSSSNEVPMRFQW